MLGDFQYYSSASENSDCETDSEDGSHKSDEGLEKLVAEKAEMEKKVQSYERKLKTIQKTLKQLNEERKRLLDLRNDMIKSLCQADISQHGSTTIQPVAEGSFSTEILDKETNMHVLSNAIEPLDLETYQLTAEKDNEEEFDSDENTQ